MLPMLFAVLALVVSAPYLIFQIKGAGLIFATISDGQIPFWLGGALTYMVVGLYVAVSGVRGVGWTNAIQGLFMAGVAIYIGWYFPTAQHGSINEMFSKIAESDFSNLLWGAGKTASERPQWEWIEYSSSLVVLSAGFTCWPHIFMKCFAAQNQASLRRMASLMPLYALFMLPLLLVGFSAILGSDSINPPDRLVPELLVGSELPLLAVGVLAAAILAASMSSGDTILHAAGSVVVHDGFKNVIDMKPAHEIFLMRLVILLLLTACYFIALNINQSIAQIYLASFGFVSQILPVTIAACYWQRSSRLGVIAGLLVGIGTSLFFLINPELKTLPLHEGFYGLAFNVFILISISLLYPDKKSIDEVQYS